MDNAGYVFAAWGITGGVLATYAAVVLTRLRRSQRAAAAASPPESA
ncbi:MAG TPA: hypothetical protein VI916_05160 [Acidimicrobiia bacterium]|nr:hypothetical protein [Acidimicrobiia bacterium]